MARRRINKRSLLILVGLLILMVGALVGMWHGQWRYYDPLPYLTRGDELYQQGLYEEAAAQYQRASTVAGRNGDTATQAIAMLKISKILPHLETEQAIGRAIGFISQAVSKDPKNLDIRKARLDLQYEVARDTASAFLWQNVKEYADDLIGMDPQNAKAHYLAGLAGSTLADIRRDSASEMLENRRQNLPYLQKASQLAPDSAEYCKVLSRVYLNIAGLIVTMRSPLPLADRQLVLDNWYQAEQAVRRLLSRNPKSGAAMVLLANLLNFPRALAMDDYRSQVAEQSIQVGELSDQELLENYLEAFRQDSPRPPITELMAALDRMTYAYLKAGEKLDADHVDVQTALADYWLAAGRRDLNKAAAALQKAVKYEDDVIAKLRLYRRIAETYSRDAQNELALEVCEKALDQPLDLKIVRAGALRMAVYNLHIFAARTLLNLTAQVKQDDTDAVQRANALLDKAEKHLEDGNAIVEATTAGPETLIIRGNIAMSRRPRNIQNVRDAIRLYEQARDQMDNMDLSKSRQLVVTYVNLQKSLAMAYDMDDQPGSAEESLAKGIDTIVQFFPQGSKAINPQVSLYLISLQLANGHLDKAEQGLAALLNNIDSNTESADPEQLELIARALMQRVRLYELQNKTMDALQTAQNIGQRFPQHIVWALTKQVQILEKEADSEAQLENLLRRWIALRPDSPEPWVLLAQLYLRNDQREKAIETLNYAVSQNPKLQDSLSMFIGIAQEPDYEKRLQLQIRQIEDLQDPLQRYMAMYRLYRGASIFYQRKALRFDRERQPELAKEAREQARQAEQQLLQALEQAYDRQPDLPAIYEPLLVFYLGQRDWDKAQKLVDRAKDENWDGVGGIYFQGLLHSIKAQTLKAEDPQAAKLEYQKALSYLERAVLDRPTFFQAWAYKSSVETGLARHEDALLSARHAVKQNPNSVQALEAFLVATANKWRRSALADDLVTAKSFADQVLASASRILKFQPNHALARTMQLSYYDTFDPEQAIKERSDILKANPKNRKNLVALIRVYQRRRETEQIKQLLSDVLAQQPNSPDLIVLLAQAYNQDGQYDKALQQLLPASKRWPDQIELVSLLAATYRANNQPAKAVACLQDFIAVAQDQDKWKGHRDLGVLQRQLGQLDEAAQNFRLAIDYLKTNQSQNFKSICNVARLLFSIVDAQQEALDVILALAEQDDQYAIQTLVFLYRQNAQIDEAVKWAQKALDLEPESTSAQVALAGALLDAGKPDQAQRILEQTVQQLRKNPKALATPYIMLSNALFMQRQYDRATQLLVDAINSGVNAPAVRRKLASYYLFQGRFEDAGQQYYLILAKHSGNAETRMALTGALVRQGRFSQAETVLAEGRSIQPEDYRWPRQLANLWLSRSDQPVKTRYDKALDFALEANDKSGGNIETTVLVMSVFNARAEYQRCEDFYSTQVPQDQKDQYRVLLPLAWAKAGRWRQGKTGTLSLTSTEMLRLQSEAVDLFYQVLNKSGDSDDTESYVAALRGLVTIRGLENLIQSARDTLSSDPQNPRIRILLATLLNRRASQRMSEKQTSMAEEDLNQVMDLLNPLLDEPNLSVPLKLGTYNQLAVLYIALKMDQQAIDTYLKLLKLKPNDIRVLNNLAYILSDVLNKPKEALPYIERALRQNPKEANLLDTYGWTLFKAGELNRAVVELGRSVDIQPTAVNYYHLGAALKEVGEAQLALRALRESTKLLQNDPVNEADIGNEVRTLLEQLEKN